MAGELPRSDIYRNMMVFRLDNLVDKSFLLPMEQRLLSNEPFNVLVLSHATASFQRREPGASPRNICIPYIFLG
jgi:hypothetical protein